MIHFTYLGLLLVSIGSMVLIDRRWSLALFHDARRALITLLIGTAVFIVWDIGGIMLDIFWIGETVLLSGVTLGPEFPLEELFFLFFLCYFSLIVYRIGEKLCSPT